MGLAFPFSQLALECLVSTSISISKVRFKYKSTPALHLIVNRRKLLHCKVRLNFIFRSLVPNHQTTRILGGVNGVFNFGLAVGALAQGWLSDALGRKKAFALAASFSFIGGALLAGSVAVTMLIVVRLPQGFGLGILLSLVPVYLTEIAPPRRRGVLSGLTTWSFTIGYLMYNTILTFLMLLTGFIALRGLE